MESIFDQLNEEIITGIKGGNESIPIGFPKLGKYANIRKNILMLIFSSTGAGKSSLTDSMVLNACDNYMQNPSITKLKPDFQLFSMERSPKLRIAKWLCYVIFKYEGVEIQLPKMLGWWDVKLTKEEHSLILKYKGYIDELLNDYVTIHGGAKSPKEIYKIMKDHFEEIGEYDDVTVKGRREKIYVPNNPKLITSPVIDHGNLIKTSQEFPSKKQAIDKAVTFMQMFRDLEGAAPIWVSQINRSISGVSRTKDQEHELMIEDIKESGDIADACDIAISLFDPIKYKQSSKTGYNPEDFIDKSNGNNYFRSAQIVKSSYGADSLRIPLAFNGFCGQFLEIPKRSDLSPQEYEALVKSIINKNYFRKK